MVYNKCKFCQSDNYDNINYKCTDCNYKPIKKEKIKPLIKKTKHGERQTNYVNRLKYNLLNFYGYMCNNPTCKEIDNLEFAHIKTTNINGLGRGMDRRYRDINKNKDSYILFCKECHTKFDKGEL